MTDTAPAPLKILGSLDAVSCEGDFCDIAAGPNMANTSPAVSSNDE